MNIKLQEHATQDEISAINASKQNVIWTFKGKHNVFNEFLEKPALKNSRINGSVSSVYLRNMMNTPLTMYWSRSKAFDKLLLLANDNTTNSLYLLNKIKLNKWEVSIDAFHNRLVYCFALALGTILQGEIEINVFDELQIKKNRLLQIKKQQLPVLDDDAYVELVTNGGKIGMNPYSMQDDVRTLMLYYWLHLPENFTGQDDLIIRKTMENMHRLFPQ